MAKRGRQRQVPLPRATPVGNGMDSSPQGKESIHAEDQGAHDLIDVVVTQMDVVLEAGVRYEWLPTRCTKCAQWGHKAVGFLDRGTTAGVLKTWRRKQVAPSEHPGDWQGAKQKEASKPVLPRISDPGPLRGTGMALTDTDGDGWRMVLSEK
ncbi:hypothetical protein Dimus_015491, partial [Dionaea muscipula]